MEEINPTSNGNIFDLGDQNIQALFSYERHPILTDNEKYNFEKQIFLSILKGEISNNYIQYPTSQELSILSHGVRKIIDQSNIINNYNNQSELVNTGSMARILSFFSRYLSNRSPVDCARIWKLVQGKREVIPENVDVESNKLPETFSNIKYFKNSTASVNKRTIAINKKKEILFGSLDSPNIKSAKIPDVSLVIPYIDSFACMTLDGQIYTIDSNDQSKYQLLLNAQKPITDFRISQNISPLVAALTNESQNIIFGQPAYFKEYSFSDKIIQFQIQSSKLCFSTKSSFFVLDDDRICASYEYSKNLNDFRILRNEMTVLGYGDTIYELFDMRTPGKVLSSSFHTQNPILDCQISPINNLFLFSKKESCSIFDLRNPSAELISFNMGNYKNPSYKAKWISDDPLIATANDNSVFNLINIDEDSSQILKSYNLPRGKILDLNTNDDTVIITQPNSIYVFQMNSRPILLPGFV